MALTAFCKKCNREVEPGDICPRCGTKLPKSAVHAAWVVERVPVRDWMCWNAVLRWLFPAGLAVLILALALEGLSGGPEAVERLFRSDFLLTLAGMIGLLLLLVFLALLLQGKELMDYVVDSRGVHVTRYLPRPTALRLILRFKSPRMMSQISPEEASPILRLEERSLPWREVSRVQLWPEKCYLLFYAPAWWLRIPVRCTPFSWEDALFYVREKLGKKKSVELPAHLRVPAGSGSASRRSTRTAVRSTPSPLPGKEASFAAAPAADASAFQPAASNPEAELPVSFSPDAPEEVPPEAGEQLSLDLEDLPPAPPSAEN